MSDQHRLVLKTSVGSNLPLVGMTDHQAHMDSARLWHVRPRQACIADEGHFWTIGQCFKFLWQVTMHGTEIESCAPQAALLVSACDLVPLQSMTLACFAVNK